MAAPDSKKEYSRLDKLAILRRAVEQAWNEAARPWIAKAIQFWFQHIPARKTVRLNSEAVLRVLQEEAEALQLRQRGRQRIITPDSRILELRQDGHGWRHIKRVLEDEGLVTTIAASTLKRRIAEIDRKLKAET
jgi:hypothetical protein